MWVISLVRNWPDVSRATLLAKGPSEICGVFWVENSGDLGGCRACFMRLGTPNIGDPGFREEKGESVDALCQSQSVRPRRGA